MGLVWRDLLDRKDALILGAEAAAPESPSEVTAVALIDTAGAARFAVAIEPGTMAWPSLHEPLTRHLEGAAVVLTWDVPRSRHLLTEASRRHGLSLPEIAWRDLGADYRSFGYVGNGMAIAAKRHGAGDIRPGALAGCRRLLAIMRACGR